MGKRSSIRDSILKLLEEHSEGVFQSVIPLALGISRSRVSEILNELEDQGIIVRIRIGNRYLIKLSKEETLVKEYRILRLGLVWSSEYPFITPFTKYLEKYLGIRINIRVYSNALQTTWALVSGDIDLALSPLITQLYMYSLTKSIRIIGGGAYGGSYIFEVRGKAKNKVASSEMSAMDTCRAISLREGVIEAENTYYFTRPEEINELIRKREAKYAIVWHPLTEYLPRKHRLKSIASCMDMGVHYCCTLAASTRLNRELRSKIARIYEKAIKSFTRNPRKWIEWYSVKVSIPADVVKRGLKTYKYRIELNKKLINEMLRRLGIALPAPTRLEEAIEQPL